MYHVQERSLEAREETLANRIPSVNLLGDLNTSSGLVSLVLQKIESIQRLVKNRG